MPLVFLTVLFLLVFAFRRAEGLGTLMIMLAAMMAAWLLTGHALPMAFGGVVELLGLHSLTLTLLLGVAGGAVRFGWPSRALLGHRRLSGLALAVLASGALLGLVSPGWTLGDVSLADVSAGGQLGTFVSGSRTGAVAGLAAGLALAWTAWPQGPGVARRLLVNLAKGAWRALVAVVRSLSPFEPAPDEEWDALDGAPQWLLAEDGDGAPESRPAGRRDRTMVHSA